MKRIILLAMKNFRITKQSNYKTFIFTSSNFTEISLFNLFTSFKTSIHNTKLRNQNLHSLFDILTRRNIKAKKKLNRNDEKVEFKKFLHYIALHWRWIRLLFGLCGNKQKKKKLWWIFLFCFECSLRLHLTLFRRTFLLCSQQWQRLFFYSSRIKRLVKNSCQHTFRSAISNCNWRL